jgi:hypothetical protein
VVIRCKPLTRCGSEPLPGFTVEELAVMEGFVGGKGNKQICQGASCVIGIISPNVT